MGPPPDVSRKFSCKKISLYYPSQLRDSILEDETEPCVGIRQDLVETIGFLFMLGSLELGRVSISHATSLFFSTDPRRALQAYMCQGMSDSQLVVLSDLVDYGLVYRSSVRSSSLVLSRDLLLA